MRRVSGLEIFLASTVALWGLVLALPASTFTGPTSAAYVPMADVAPEGVWSVACLLLGFGQLVGILAYGRKHRAVVPLRFVALALDAAFFGFLAGMFSTVSLGIVGTYLWAAYLLAAVAVMWSTARG